jgi:hypothetical protein
MLPCRRHDSLPHRRIFQQSILSDTFAQYVREYDTCNSSEFVKQADLRRSLGDGIRDFQIYRSIRLLTCAVCFSIAARVRPRTGTAEVPTRPRWFLAHCSTHPPATTGLTAASVPAGLRVPIHSALSFLPVLMRSASYLSNSFIIAMSNASVASVQGLARIRAVSEHQLVQGTV